jgi:hypothetical protein
MKPSMADHQNRAEPEASARLHRDAAHDDNVKRHWLSFAAFAGVLAALAGRGEAGAEERNEAASAGEDTLFGEHPANDNADQDLMAFNENGQPIPAELLVEGNDPAAEGLVMHDPQFDYDGLDLGLAEAGTLRFHDSAAASTSEFTGADGSLFTDFAIEMCAQDPVEAGPESPARIADVVYDEAGAIDDMRIDQIAFNSAYDFMP